MFFPPKSIMGMITPILYHTLSKNGMAFYKKKKIIVNIFIKKQQKDRRKASSRAKENYMPNYTKGKFCIIGGGESHKNGDFTCFFRIDEKRLIKDLLTSPLFCGIILFVSNKKDIGTYYL